MQLYIQEREDFVLLNTETPLISNLDICENIALIKSVHENMSTKKAERLALDMLTLLGLQKIAHQRAYSCSKKEIFLVMFIRAMMMKENTLIIKSPNDILGNSQHIKEVVIEMIKIDIVKDICIVDLQRNENYYKGCACSTKE